MRQFVIRPSAAAARQIMRLKAIAPETIVGPEIEELAREGLISAEDAEGLEEHSQALLQDLMDFNLRAVIAIQNRIFLSAGIDVWLTPILRAAKRHGVTSIAFVEEEHFASGTAKTHARLAGFDVYSVNHAFSVMEEDCPVPRSAVLVIPLANSLLYSASTRQQILPLALEFKRTVILADTLGANSTRLFPKQPSLLQVFNDSDEPLAKLPTRQVGFLFNTSYALARLDIQETDPSISSGSV